MPGGRQLLAPAPSSSKASRAWSTPSPGVAGSDVSGEAAKGAILEPYEVTRLVNALAWRGRQRRERRASKGRGGPRPVQLVRRLLQRLPRLRRAALRGARHLCSQQTSKV